MTEAEDIQTPTVEWAKRNGWVEKRLRIVNQRGFPDYTFFRPGPIVAFIEFKVTGKKLSGRQVAHVVLLRDMGFPVCVAYSAEQAIDFLRELMP